MPEPQVGDRVRVIGRNAIHEGTCKYFGTTLFREGYWVGVALDYPNGKNDGCVEGTRYFSCRPNYGLFARVQVVEILQSRRQMQQQQQQQQQQIRHQHPPQPQENGNVAPTTSNSSSWQSLGGKLQVKASIFRFEKVKNEWLDIGDGFIDLFVALRSQNNSSDSNGVPFVTLQGSRENVGIVNHYIEVETKLEPNVGSDRAWVFRAKTLNGDKGEVLALQFPTPKDAMDFSSHFARCCQTARHHSSKSSSNSNNNRNDNNNNNRYANGGAGPAPPAPQTGGYNNGKTAQPPPPP